MNLLIAKEIKSIFNINAKLKDDKLFSFPLTAWCY